MTPNISLQRTSSRRLAAAELNSFGRRIRRLQLGWALLLVGCISGTPRVFHYSIRKPGSGSPEGACGSGFFHQVTKKSARTRHLAGLVVDPMGDPLGGTTVVLEGTKCPNPAMCPIDFYLLRTLDDGRFKFNGLGRGTYRVSFCNPGFAMLTRYFDLDPEADDLPLKIAMSPDA